MFRVEIFFILLGLFIGIFVVYVTTPLPKIVYKYPTIENIQNTTYIDEKGQCYRYYAIEFPCKNMKSPETDPEEVELNQ
uniref:Uncharacterized protein n=1 Tax=viral metagenome TaxID=1070528 RepID=A0A6C0LQB3_9ZZZZ